jgi:hypothetical protein
MIESTSVGPARQAKDLGQVCWAESVPVVAQISEGPSGGFQPIQNGPWFGEFRRCLRPAPSRFTTPVRA